LAQSPTLVTSQVPVDLGIISEYLDKELKDHLASNYGVVLKWNTYAKEYMISGAIHIEAAEFMRLIIGK